MSNQSVGVLALVLALTVGGCLLWARNYGECREHGFSKAYCVSQGR